MGIQYTGAAGQHWLEVELDVLASAATSPRVCSLVLQHRLPLPWCPGYPLPQPLIWLVARGGLLCARSHLCTGRYQLQCESFVGRNYLMLFFLMLFPGGDPGKTGEAGL